MTAQEIKRELQSMFINSNYRLFNAYVFDYESDFFCITKSGYCIEVEIKVSRSDFKNDFTKKHWRGDQTKHELLKDKTKTFKPNRFYFAVPEGLIDKSEVPEYAGLIYITNNAYRVKEAPFLHKEKLLKDSRLLKSLLDKFYYRNIDLRRQMSLRDSDLKYGQQVLEII